MTNPLKTVELLLKNVVLFRQRLPMSLVMLLLIGLFMPLTSCGYHFSSIGGIVPQGAKTIAVSVFINDTTEPYVDVDITKAVADEFLTDGRLNVVSEDAADLVLRGHVTKFFLTAQAYTAASYVQAYNVSITVSISVEDTKTQKLILQDVALTDYFTSTYAVAIGDISQTKIAKEAAVQSACQDIASTVRSRVLDGF
jgi:outer membrane lipopolysaccharide assembly protein LptE/RlpB